MPMVDTFLELLKFKDAEEFKDLCKKLYGEFKEISDEFLGDHLVCKLSEPLYMEVRLLQNTVQIKVSDRIRGKLIVLSKNPDSEEFVKHFGSRRAVGIDLEKGSTSFVIQRGESSAEVEGKVEKIVYNKDLNILIIS